MSKEFYQHKDYPKISKDYTVDDIKKFLSTIEFTFNDEFKCLDDIMSNVITHNNYCEYSKISVDSFEFFGSCLVLKQFLLIWQRQIIRTLLIMK